MSPQISQEEWESEEQIAYLTYKEMAALILTIHEVAEGYDGKSEMLEILNGIESKFWVELKPVLYDADIKKLGGKVGGE
jgi:hypothetical protein